MQEKKDLMSLLDKKVIPEEYYTQFFEEIPTAKKNISDRVSDDEYDDE